MLVQLKYLKRLLLPPYFVLYLGYIIFLSSTKTQACIVPEIPEGALNILNFGAISDNIDDTASIQAAIDATPIGGTLYVPAGTFLINPDDLGVWLHSDMKLLMHDEAILQATPSSLPYYTVVSLDGIKNVTVSGGTIRGERDQHIGNIGEWGIAIAIWNSENIVLSHLTTRDSFGDGIYIADEPEFGQITRNISVCNVISDNNRRGGISVVGARDVLIESSKFSGSNGIAPETGIILEANHGKSLYNIKVQNSRIINNSGYGIYLDGVDGPNDFTTIEHSTISNNGSYGIRVAGTDESYISHNLIENNGVGQQFCSGINLYYARNSSVERNSIRDNETTNRSGVVIDFGESSGVEIVDNDICIIDELNTVLDFSLEKNTVKSGNTYCERDAHVTPYFVPLESYKLVFLPLLLK